MNIHTQFMQLYQELQKQKITARQMADAIGVHENEISRFKHQRRNITLDTIRKLAEAFGYSVKINIEKSLPK